LKAIKLSLLKLILRLLNSEEIVGLREYLKHENPAQSCFSFLYPLRKAGEDFLRRNSNQLSFMRRWISSSS